MVKCRFAAFHQKQEHSNRLGIPPGWLGVLRKLWGLEMPADNGGVEGFGGFAGAGIRFAFGKIGELCGLLAEATASETALERYATAVGQIPISIFRWTVGQGGGGRTAHGRCHAGTAFATAEQRLVQRLPQWLRAEDRKMDGQYEGYFSQWMLLSCCLRSKNP